MSGPRVKLGLGDEAGRPTCTPGSQAKRNFCLQEGGSGKRFSAVESTSRIQAKVSGEGLE